MAIEWCSHVRQNQLLQLLRVVILHCSATLINISMKPKKSFYNPIFINIVIQTLFCFAKVNYLYLLDIDGTAKMVVSFLTLISVLQFRKETGKRDAELKWQKPESSQVRNDHKSKQYMR